MDTVLYCTCLSSEKVKLEENVHWDQFSKPASIFIHPSIIYSRAQHEVSSHGVITSHHITYGMDRIGSITCPVWPLSLSMDCLPNMIKSIFSFCVDRDQPTTATQTQQQPPIRVS